MAWSKVGSLKGPKGDPGERGPAGPQGPAASAEEVFDRAHPVGTIIETDSAVPPDRGGTWEAVARPGVNAYKRTS